MAWKISGLLIAVVTGLGLVNPSGVLAVAYEGMCSDSVTITMPPKCKTPSFVEVSVVDTTFCELFNDPECPDNQSEIGTEVCGAFGAGEKAICKETCVEYSECLECFSGYYGDTCESKCACPNNMICEDGIDGDGSCQCFPNWTGLNCNQCAPNHFGNDCNPCACGDTAICEDGVSGNGSCSCNDGFQLEGSDCVNINECSPPPVVVCTDVNPNDGCPYETCDDAVGLLDPFCIDQNWDVLCENCAASMVTDEADCSELGDACMIPAPLPCTADNSSCQDTQGSYLCVCNAGYAGDGTLCQNVNECEQNQSSCDPNALCTDEPGSYNCTCNDGFAGDGVSCADINECENEQLNTCSANASCSNEPGSFSCTCNAGYGGDGVTCDDVNECELGTPCSDNALCANQPGSFTCTCNAGYEGDGVTCDNVNECEGTETIILCSQAGILCEEETCYEAVYGLDFFCDENSWDDFCAACAASQPGYDGLDCSSVGEACELVKALTPCADNASCTDTEGSYECACLEGYEGDGFTCENINECELGTVGCDAQATCEDTMGSAICTCDDGYFGDGFSCCEDLDGDGVCVDADNCPTLANPEQVDTDNDKIGDACECTPDTLCDDENVCTDDTCNPNNGCVFIPNNGSCDDGNICTTNSCEEGICAVQFVDGNCCTEDAQCGENQGCHESENVCADIQCAPCETDADCGEGNGCKSYPSGMHCALSCDEDPSICGEASECQASAEEGAKAFCVPIQGDCTCVETEALTCQDGSLFEVDSCGALGALADDCGDWGCASGVCLDETGSEGPSEEGGAEEGGAEEGGAEEGGAEEGGAEEGGAEEGGAEEGGAEEGGAEEGGAEEGGEKGGGGPGGDVDSEEGGENYEPREVVAIAPIDDFEADTSPSVVANDGGGCRHASSRNSLPFGFLLLGVFLFRIRRTRFALQ